MVTPDTSEAVSESRSMNAYALDETRGVFWRLESLTFNQITTVSRRRVDGAPLTHLTGTGEHLGSFIILRGRKPLPQSERSASYRSGSPAVGASPPPEPGVRPARQAELTADADARRASA